MRVLNFGTANSSILLGVGIVPRCKSDDEVGDVEHDAFEPMALTILRD
jgi:hypothetical protein